MANKKKSKPTSKPLKKAVTLADIHAQLKAIEKKLDSVIGKRTSNRPSQDSVLEFEEFAN